MKNYHLPICLLFAFIFINACKGQEKPNAPAVHQPSKAVRLSPLDSVAQISEYVVEIFEDSKGNLWFGTMSDGAVRYDGQTLTYFSTKDGLIDNTVACIAEDQRGNIWFGTHNGASRYNGKSFTNYGRAEGLHGAGCIFLVDKRGGIWAGTNHGAFRFNGIGFSAFELPKPVVQDSSRKWEAGKIWGMMEDKMGNIWFARDAYGACKYNPSATFTPSFTHFTKKDGLCSNNVCSIVEDKQGHIWFGCLSTDLPKEIKEGGLCRYDGQKFVQFTEQEGLSKNDIYTVYQDKSGNIWIGATGVGVYRYDGQSFRFFKETDRMDLTWSRGLQSMLDDSKGRLWLGFSGGLFRFDGNGIVNVPKGGLWN
jgi:ligand-binding sensor domain-containing protein